ncbi:IS607 family transposase [Clostridium kluyveri]|uniref:IS607 family transposase n=1 Tax=Clostridium kluyveri TaxID=1534 RepID=A0A1L5F9W1_CLOKL|nr:IS607 family transposase [Clostridium kluyveri]APM39805.1 IS607 family transposase [Clostridium kluyveri]UZQ50033.1 IS607 family transposase [Clostridium kluyveri]
MYSIGKFAEKLGVTIQTLRNWDKEGKLSPIKLDSGHRRYTEEHLLKALNMIRKPLLRKTLIYARVSSNKQKNELKHQLENLKQFCIAKGYVIDEIFSDIGSALNYNRPEFQKMWDLILSNQVERIIIAYKDRFARFGYDFFETMCKRFNIEIVIMNKAEEKTYEQEMIEDLMTIVHVFSARLYGSRSYKQKKLINVVKEVIKEDVQEER